MDGLDEADIDSILAAQDRERPVSPPLNREFVPVDRGFAERIYKMFARPFDRNWQMPDLDGPEYAQPPKTNPFDNGDRGSVWPPPSRGGGRNSGGPLARTMEFRFGRDDKGGPMLLANAATGVGSGDGGFDTSPDPLFPGNGAQVQSTNPQTAPPSQPTPKRPQELWDEHIWKSPEVVMAQTPREKREAVNRILAERQGDFDAAYRAAYGDKAASQWENDRKYTMGAMGDYVSADQLKAFGWQNVNDDMVKDLNNTLIKYDITTPARIRHFLSQAAKESGKGGSTTELYDGDPYEYFENLYGRGRRPDLGNLEEGEGYKYRGGGYIQTTGKNNYKKFRDEVNDDDVMKRGADAISEKYPWMAAGFWWKDNNMNNLVDGLKGVDHDADVDEVTGKVNPGDSESRPERRGYYKEWYKIIPD